MANAWANEITWTSGTPLYVLATLRTLAAYSPTPVRVVVDGAAIETRAWLVAVGNTRTYASGMMITPAASVHDGLLDVCVVGPVSRSDFLRTNVDGTRHVKPGMKREAAVKSKGVNILFLDGHAASGTPVDAWNSIACPGKDGSIP